MLSNIVNDENCPLDIETIDWLKSLRPQKQWKPSELELASLGMIIEHPDRMTNYNIENLKSLYEQLKAL